MDIVLYAEYKAQESQFTIGSLNGMSHGCYYTVGKLDKPHNYIYYPINNNLLMVKTIRKKLHFSLF